MINLQFPIVSYDEHPAFHGIRPEFTPGFDDQVAQLVRRIEEAVEQLASARTIVSRVRQQRRFRSLCQDLARLIEQESTIDRTLRTALVESANAAYRSVNAQLKYERTRNYATARAIKADQGVVHQLKEKGAVAITLPQRVIQELTESVEPIVQEVRAKSGKNPTVRNLARLKRGTQEFNLVERIASEAGLLALAEAYHGHEMVLNGAAVEVSTPKAEWYRECYRDIGLDTARSVYLHYDYEYDLQKFAIYLGDVTDDNGPFSYVLGSNKCELPRFLFTFVKEFEQTATKRNVFERSGTYYRPPFHGEKNRRLFMQIPAALRGASHFGDDLLDGSQLQRQLLENEKFFTSADGNCVMFDGHYGMHRGGLATGSERAALFLTLDPKRSTLDKVRGRLSRILQRTS